MAPPSTDVRIAVMAKAPLAGLAKTRLIPELGAHGAAVLAERLLERAVETAVAAAIGPVSVWATPDPRHRAFRDLAAHHMIALETQPAGDLGARMLAAIAAARGRVIVTGTDCPALTGKHLQRAALALQQGDDVAFAPAEDGGYVLIGVNRPLPELFAGMTWSTPHVMAETRARIAQHGLRAHELTTLWDVDTPQDLARLEREFPELAV
jgi:rSAM/selenodomain-associated transferase 1